MSRTISETGDPYLPAGYVGPVAACGDCGNDAPAAPVVCPSPNAGHPGRHPMCEPCRVGASELYEVPIPRPVEVYAMGAGSHVSHATLPQQAVALCGRWTGVPVLPQASPFDPAGTFSCRACARRVHAVNSP